MKPVQIFSRERFFFTAMTAGASASAAVALLFLAMDSASGDPFATPSLMGSMVLAGASADTVDIVRMDLVSAYSIVHFTLFGLIGLATTWLASRVDFLRENPLLMAAGLFAALGLGVAAIDAVLYPGLMEAVGYSSLILANAVAASVLAGAVYLTMTREDLVTEQS